MSYWSKENSTAGSQPIELYTFAQGEHLWYYTNAAVDITWQSSGNKFIAIPINRTAYAQTQTAEDNSIQLTVPRDNEIAAKFIGYNPAAIVWVTIYRFQKGDTELMTQFVGCILSANFVDSQAILKVASLQTILQRKIPRVLYQSVCNHVLFSPYCGVDSSVYKTKAQIATINNNDITITNNNFSANWFTFGYAVSAFSEYRMIIAQTGTHITLLRAFAGIVPGDIITVYPGCNRMEDTCASKFNNRTNFLGWSHIPTKNPFIGGLT